MSERANWQEKSAWAASWIKNALGIEKKGLSRKLPLKIRPSQKRFSPREKDISSLDLKP